MSFASGWHANDFVFAPEKYQDRKAITFRDVDVVRRLWRGESVSVENGAGGVVDVRIYPRPVQSELPFWITAAGDPETFRMAGEMGANLLTHLLGATMETLAQNLAIYRKAWRDHGHGRDGRQGCVTLMLHTFVGDDLRAVREKVRAPLMNYLRSASNLARKAGGSRDNDRAVSELSEADVNTAARAEVRPRLRRRQSAGHAGDMSRNDRASRGHRRRRGRVSDRFWRRFRFGHGQLAHAESRSGDQRVEEPYVAE